MGIFVESLCLLAGIHLNMPVVLQYFCCCRSLTRSATEQDKAKKVLAVLHMAADAEAELGEKDAEGNVMQKSPQNLNK